MLYRNDIEIQNQKPVRWKYVIENHSLSDYDRDTVNYALKSKSPVDAIKRADFLLKKDRERTDNFNLTYSGREFLNALAISAELDLQEKTVDTK